MRQGGDIVRPVADASPNPGNPAPQRRPRSSSEQRRREIVRHAADLMDTVGYHNTSMGSIAAAAGLRKPSLYYYFHSKQEILFYIHEEVMNLLIERQRRRLDLPMTSEQRVLESIVDLLELMDTHRGYIRAYFENTRELGPNLLPHALAKRNEYQQFLRDQIEEGVKTGQFRDVDPFLASRSLFGMCIWCYFWYQGDFEGHTHREIAYTFWDLVVHGLKDTSDNNRG